MIIYSIVSVLIVILYRMVKRYKGEIPSAKRTVVAFIFGFLFIPLSIIILEDMVGKQIVFTKRNLSQISKPVGYPQSQYSSCSDDYMLELALESAIQSEGWWPSSYTMSRGQVVLVEKNNKYRGGKFNFNYYAQFYPDVAESLGIPPKQLWQIWLKIECINGEPKVTDYESSRVD
jgi:hypothetical protein